MSKSEDVVFHLQIIHIWAEFALENDLGFFNAGHLRDIGKWTTDAAELIKQTGTVEYALDVLRKNGWKEEQGENETNN